MSSSVVAFLMLFFALETLQYYGNLIINGNFRQPALTAGKTYEAVYSVTGWTSKYFQLFNAKTFNSKWPEKLKCCEIANIEKETLYQNIKSGHDYYTLYFQYAKSYILPAKYFNQTQATVLWNGYMVQQISVSDNMVHNVSLKLITNANINQIKFRPSGVHNLHGICFTNVQMIGQCKPNKTYNSVREKCMPSLLNCLQTDQISGKCNKCSLGFYSQQNICKSCLLPCQTCQDSPRNCLSCPQFYLLQGKQCVIADTLAYLLTLFVSFPGSQILTVGQILIGNLDQFWPYYSHNRQYGQQTQGILTFIHTMENSKWLMLSLDKKIDFNFNTLNFSDYSQYSNPQFLAKQDRTSYFWDGAFEILFFCFPVSILVFFLLNKTFYLTFNYRISRHFRPFSFYFMIYVLGFQGNISYLGFLSCNNSINLFSFKFQDKFGHSVWVFVFFLLIFFCFAGFYVVKILYHKLSKYFITDYFPKIQSFALISVQQTKELAIGATNAFLATKYQALLICLTSIELMNVIGLAYFQRKFRCYRMQFFMYLSMLKSILMCFFNVFLWIDWKMPTIEQQLNQQIKHLLDFNCKTLIIIIISLGVLQIIAAYFSQRKNKLKQIKNNQKKKNNFKLCMKSFFKKDKTIKKREIKQQKKSYDIQNDNQKQKSANIKYKQQNIDKNKRLYIIWQIDKHQKNEAIDFQVNL